MGDRIRAPGTAAAWAAGSGPAAPDDIAGEELWRIYRPRLVVFARNFGGACARQPEDIAHEIITLALARRSRFDGTHAFSTWLYTLARNRCVDVERRERRRLAITRRNIVALAAPHAPVRGPEAQADRSATMRAVSSAVERLPDRDRVIAFLRHYEELPVADIAGILGMPEGSVKYRLHRIAMRLRRELADWEEDGGEI